MPTVRIYRPAKTAMQSGRAQTQEWVLEFEPGKPKLVEPLMGWTSGRDTRDQVQLSFETRETAVAYAEKHGLDYTVEQPHDRAVKPKSYADNFRAGRVGNWTH